MKKYRKNKGCRAKRKEKSKRCRALQTKAGNT